MKKIGLHFTLYALLCTAFLQGSAQQRDFSIRCFLSPVITFPVHEKQEYRSGVLTKAEKERSTVLFFGAGFDFIRNFRNGFSAGATIAFASKGYLATTKTYYDAGGYSSGAQFERSELNFAQTKLFAEKNFNTNKANSTFFLSGGFYFSQHLPAVISFMQKVTGNDYGACFAAGVKRKRFYGMVDLQKGFTNIANTSGITFKTASVGINAGYYIRM